MMIQVYYIYFTLFSIIIISSPPQIIQHQILEVGDPLFRHHLLSELFLRYTVFLEPFVLNKLFSQKKKCMDFQFKMVEQKDTCSSPAVRAPKLQLAVERPLTEDIGTHQKKKKGLCPKTKKKLQRDGRMGTNAIKSNPIHEEWEAHKLKNNNTKEVLQLLCKF